MLNSQFDQATKKFLTMAYLNISFNNELISKHELTLPVTKIGRNPDNDIVIDNLGVSGYHAEITKKDESFFVQDKESTNGVYVNGNKVSEKEIKFGDEISIFKHKLKLIAIESPMDVKESIKDDSSAAAQSATVDIDISQLNNLLKEDAAKTAYIEALSGKQAGQKFKLSKTIYSFGKAKDCDFKVGGWFAPKNAAKIIRQSDGHYLVPEKRGKISLNDQVIKTRTKLTDNCQLKVQGIQFRFQKSY